MRIKCRIRMNVCPDEIDGINREHAHSGRDYFRIVVDFNYCGLQFIERLI